jgi:hypothetical protein
MSKVAGQQGCSKRASSCGYISPKHESLAASSGHAARILHPVAKKASVGALELRGEHDVDVDAGAKGSWLLTGRAWHCGSNHPTSTIGMGVKEHYTCSQPTPSAALVAHAAGQSADDQRILIP